jgi:hypothetical protein
MSTRARLAFRIALLVVLPLLVPACFASKTKDWLAAKAIPGAAEINIAGYWTNTDWGDGYFQQDGCRVSGSLGGYQVRGVVNQNVVYLAIDSRGYPAFTAMLWLEEADLLGGNWVRGRIVRGRGDGELLVLRRLKS